MFYPILFTAVINDGGKKWCTISVLVMFFSKIALSFILCYYLGIRGLSMSTIISLLSASIILLHQFKEKNNPLKFKFYFKWEDAFKMLKAGFEDALLFYLFFTLFMSFYNWFLLKYFNVDALIIFTLVLTMQSLLIAVYDGLVRTIQPIIATYRGEDNIVGMSKTLKVSFVVSTAIPHSLRQYLSPLIVSSHRGNHFSISIGDNRTKYEF